jgi:hypothetical protein
VDVVRAFCRRAAIAHQLVRLCSNPCCRAAVMPSFDENGV